MKYKKICPECGGNEIFMKAVDAVGGYGPNLLPSVGTFWDRQYFELFVCGNCGYAQFFVPKQFLPTLKEKYQPVIQK